MQKSSKQLLDASSPQPRWRRILIFLIKLGVSGIVLYLLVRAVDFDRLADRINLGSLVPLASGFSIGALMLVFAGLRWRAIHGGIRAPIPRGFSIAATMEAYTYNIVLPGSIGGDILRAMRAVKYTGKLREGLIAAIGDRGANVAALILLSLPALPYLATQETGGRLFWATVLLAITAAVGLGMIVAAPGLRRNKSLRRWRVVRESIRAGLIVRRLLASFGVVGLIGSYSVLVQSSNIAMLWFAGQAIGASGISIFVLTLATVFGLLASAIPISFAGLGVREGAIVWVLMEAGIDSQIALTVALTFAILVVGQAVPGLIVIMSGRLPSFKDARENRPSLTV